MVLISNGGFVTKWLDKRVYEKTGRKRLNSFTKPALCSQNQPSAPKFSDLSYFGSKALCWSVFKSASPHYKDISGFVHSSYKIAHPQRICREMKSLLSVPIFESELVEDENVKGILNIDSNRPDSVMKYRDKLDKVNMFADLFSELLD